LAIAVGAHSPSPFDVAQQGHRRLNPTFINTSSTIETHHTLTHYFFLMAAARLQAILACFGCVSPEPKLSASYYPDEKRALLSAEQPRADIQLADNVVATMMSAISKGPALRMQLDSAVGTYGWTENLAKWVLEKLCLALQNAHDNLGPAVREAYNRAWEVAKGIEGFVIEHPVFCTVIALGVLVRHALSIAPITHANIVSHSYRSSLRHGLSRHWASPSSALLRVCLNLDAV
jgi:hypothetical protein